MKELNINHISIGHSSIFNGEEVNTAEARTNVQAMQQMLNQTQNHHNNNLPIDKSKQVSNNHANMMMGGLLVEGG